MLVVGLTGGIASGKSTVAAMFENKGAVVFDTDSIAKDVVSVNEPAWQEIVANFGEEILLEDRNIDRKKLGNIVFKDTVSRDKLNSIVHPRVIEKLINETDRLKENNSSTEVIVYDVPLLVESGMYNMVDAVVLVFTSPDVQKERLKKRDGLSDEEIEDRISAQLPLEEKKRYADYTIDNGGSIKETSRQVDEFWSILPLLKSKKIIK